VPIDLRAQKLAKFVVNNALRVKHNENVIIGGSTEAEEFILALYKEVVLAGAHPLLRVSVPGLKPFFYKNAKKHQIAKYPGHIEYMINSSQKYVDIATDSNTRELSSCDPKKITARAKVTKKISDLICQNKPKMYRCTVAFPCMALAQEAEMSLNEYENFVYNATIGVDWKKLSKLMNKILSKFKEGGKVHLIGKNVDLKFQVHGKKAISDLDFDNFPAGEVFMAPLRESLNGKVKFDYPAIRDGKEVTDIELTFKNGKVIDAKSSKNEDFLKAMLATDENSSFVGEFGIGCNPNVTKFTKNLLFDEKIGGTIHLALGTAYTENGGGNDSAIHWDIVKDMKKAKIIVDGKVIQENGKWKL
jgi:aminopeptidase